MGAPTETLYRAILDDPEADVPRRALSEFLRAEKDPRGDFIRFQLDAWDVRKKRGWGTAEEAMLNLAADELKVVHGKTWAKELEPVPAATQLRFYRGFVEAVTIDARAFLEQGASLYKVAPIRHLSLTGVKGVIDAIAATPLLGRLVGLVLQMNQLDDADVARLVTSPHLSKLKRLDLGTNSIGEAGLEAIAASAQLPALRYLNLANNPVSLPGEAIGADGSTVTLPKEGQLLEAKYGPKPWLHGPSTLVTWPPTEGDF